MQEAKDCGLNYTFDGQQTRCVQRVGIEKLRRRMNPRSNEKGDGLLTDVFGRIQFGTERIEREPGVKTS